ncbi:MAG: AbrB/MazE/SpoVT family DNA-binding domain-containing protein [Candidatus Freyarchaeota archaeon]
MVENSVVRRKFTLTIPMSIRKKLNIREGMEVQWRVEGNKIIIEPRTFRNLHGRFEGAARYTAKKDKEEVEKVFVKEAGKHERKAHFKGAHSPTAFWWTQVLKRSGK